MSRFAFLLRRFLHSWQELLLFGLFGSLLAVLGVALGLAWAIIDTPGLLLRLMFMLLSVAFALLLLLFGLVWAWLVRPLSILDGELGAVQDAENVSNTASLIGRLMGRVRALIEEHQRTRLALEASTENMREAEKFALVGKLAAGVAHSIRNPLTGLKLRFFSLSRGLSLNEKQSEHIKAINDALAHMEKIVSNFLSVSRKPKLEKSECSISDIIDRALLLLEPRIDAYKITVRRNSQGRMPTTEADAEKLCEALLNLLANACEASGMHGEVVINEEMGRLGGLGRVLVVRIHDSGPGIPENLRKVIFKPFISTKKEGTGLGLPIAKRIFEEHGGWLNLHCVEGEGATFVCVIPFMGKDDLWCRYS